MKAEALPEQAAILPERTEKTVFQASFLLTRAKI